MLPFYTLLSYLLISCLYFGMGVLNHFNTHFVGFEADPALFTWMLNWWPFALTHHMNPFYTNYAWWPIGFSIANTTAIPLLALLMWPITSLLGANISYNILALLAPAVSAWTMFFLCRYLTRSTVSAWVGGFIFGFSTYQIGQTLGGHLNLTFVFIFPLLILISIRFCQKNTTRYRALFWLTLCLLVQFGIAREVFVSALVMAGFAWLLALAYFKAYRRQLLILLVLTTIALLITLLLYWPYLSAFFHHLHDAKTESILSEVGQPLNLILPTTLTWLIPKSWADISPYVLWGSKIEISLYFGVAMLAIWLVFCCKGWRKIPHQRYLFWAFIIPIVLSFGPLLYLGQQPLMPLPGWILYHLPIINKLIPVRLDLYAWMVMAIVMSLWLVREDIADHWKWPLALIAIVMILPSFSSEQRPWQSTIERPAFIYQDDYKKWIKPNEPVLFVTNQPHHAAMMRWQVATHMYFKLYTGYVNFYPPKAYPFQSFAQQTISRNYTAQSAVMLHNMITHYQIPLLITNADTLKRWPFLFSGLGQHIKKIGGLSIYVLQ